MGTLNLKKPEMPAPEAGPVFDEEAHYGEVGGVDGVAYIQGKALFNRAKKYVGPAPKEMWLAPLTPEQEQDRRKKLQANKKFFGSKPVIPNTAAVPQKIADAERENAQARRAETQAA